MRTCAVIGEPADRLICYDRLAGAVGDGGRSNSPGESAAPRSGEPAVTASAASAAPPLTLSSARIQQEPIESRLQILDRTARGQHRFTLQNQQVWVEVTPGRGGFRAGSPVRIDPTSMGSFVLIDGDGRSTRVRRVQ
jgi:hypothetical protein